MKTKTRASLHIETLDALTRLKLNTAPWDQMDLGNAFDCWLKGSTRGRYFHSDAKKNHAENSNEKIVDVDALTNDLLLIWILFLPCSYRSVFRNSLNLLCFSILLFFCWCTVPCEFNVIWKLALCITILVNLTVICFILYVIRYSWNLLILMCKVFKFHFARVHKKKFALCTSANRVVHKKGLAASFALSKFRCEKHNSDL